MKKKILWLVLSWLIVAVLVLTSCGEAVPGEQEEEEEEEEEEEAGLPQYGGTLTIFTGKSKVDPPSADMRDAQSSSFPYWQTIQEMLLIGDFEKYGPRGTGEFAFQMRDRLPPPYTTGCLLESWETTHDEITMHVRPGIYWQAGNVDYMENRELTAEDIAWDINEFWHDSPWGGRFDGVLSKVYATDKYTVIAEFEKYSSFFMYWAGSEDRATYGPPEVRTVDAAKWENTVGTGLFMFDSQVFGSSITFKRNPNYWKGTTIDGVEYEIPFLDRVIYAIIPDAATQLAALRTATIDWSDAIPIAQWESLAETAPGLLSASYILAGDSLKFQHKEPPFNDREVRRAMMIGTDINAFWKLGMVDPDPSIHFYPILPSSTHVYTPLEELDADIREMYTYDVDKAIDILADAGYPDGFKVLVNVISVPDELDKASLLKDQWDLIGVEVEINSLDATTFTLLERGSTFHGILVGGDSMVDPVGNVYEMAQTLSKGGWKNDGDYSDPDYDILVSDMMAEVDEDEINRMAMEAAEWMLRDVVALPLFPSKSGHHWWPWVKNYYGEKTIADLQGIQVLSYAWIDEGLKAEMGY